MGVLWESGVPGRYYKSYSPCITRVRAESVILVGSQTCSQWVLTPTGLFLLQIQFVVYMTYHGEDSCRARTHCRDYISHLLWECLGYPPDSETNSETWLGRTVT